MLNKFGSRNFGVLFIFGNFGRGSIHMQNAGMASVCFSCEDS